MKRFYVTYGGSADYEVIGYVEAPSEHAANKCVKRIWGDLCLDLAEAGPVASPRTALYSFTRVAKNAFERIN